MYRHVLYQPNKAAWFDFILNANRGFPSLFGNNLLSERCDALNVITLHSILSLLIFKKVGLTDVVWHRLVRAHLRGHWAVHC